MDLIVSRRGAHWRARFGAADWRCAVGPGGIRHDKHEGDGATPAGCWALRRVLYRSDRFGRPVTTLPVAALVETDGWCDDPADPSYNRQVVLPHAASHERLWRDDGIYDLIVVLGHNDEPPISGAGSAVFLHLARPDYAPTQGCVALARDHLLAVLEGAGPETRLCAEAD